ncbi:hypothetical protein Tco_1364442, partial [Tanacetum coccineum]
IVSSGWSFVSAVLGQMTYLVASLALDSARFLASYSAVGDDHGYGSYCCSYSGDPVGLFHSNRLGVCISPGQGIIEYGVSLGPMFLLGLSVLAMLAACASRAAATLSVISCRMAAWVIAVIADVDVFLGGIYQDNIRQHGIRIHKVIS